MANGARSSTGVAPHRKILTATRPIIGVAARWTACPKLRWVGDKPDEVRKLATQIRTQANTFVAANDSSEAEEEVEFPEGRIATKLHRARERAKGLRRQVLGARAKLGPLRCDCCGAHGLTTGDKAEEAVFEVHHLVPLAELGERKTKLVDVSLLCANCHRAIHQAIKDLGRWILPAELAVLVAPGWGKRF